MLVPLADAVLLHAQISGSKRFGEQGFTVPCNMQESVALHFGGRSFTISPANMIYLGTQGDDCISSIVVSDINNLNNHTYLVSVYDFCDLLSAHHSLS